jgi:hypothetical protein
VDLECGFYSGSALEIESGAINNEHDQQEKTASVPTV